MKAANARRRLHYLVALRQTDGPESITRMGWNLYDRNGEVGVVLICQIFTFWRQPRTISFALRRHQR
jgi:hypothetical protein